MTQNKIFQLGVIFDMDGVLVDSNPAHLKAFQAIGEEIGIPFPESLFPKVFGMHNNDIFPTWLGSDLDPSKSAALASRKEALYRKLVPENVHPLPGVIPLIEQLYEAGFTLAVGSSGPRDNVELIVDQLGIRQFFKALCNGDEVEHGKPHPKVFLNALTRTALTPQQCVVIEDAPAGVEAARRAGIPVIAITSSRQRADLKEASWIIDSMTELNPKILEKFIARCLPRT